MHSKSTIRRKKLLAPGQYRSLLLLWLASLLLTANAELVTDTPTITILPEAKPHWVWVGGLGGTISLIDADNGNYLATLSNGASLMKLDFPGKASYFYSTETHYSRGTRGTRTDVVTLFDRFSLQAVDEIEVPPRTYDGMALMPLTALSDNEKYLYVFNMTPAQSVTVVDLEDKKVVAEIPTPGCALIYPSPAQRFHMLCGDGAMTTITIDKDGGLPDRARSPVFFDPNNDPLMEKAVRLGDSWFFPSFEGYLYEVDGSGKTAHPAKPWSLITGDERKEKWRVGGALPIAAHTARNRIYILMHQGGIDTHKEQGNQIWEFDPVKRERTRIIKLKKPVTSIQVTQDERALLVLGAEAIEGPRLEIYDLASGLHQRTINNLGTMVVTLIQPYAR